MNGMIVFRRVIGDKQLKKAARPIVFGGQRPVSKRNGTRRFFAPMKNMIGDMAESAANNPPTILRMVSDYS